MCLTQKDQITFATAYEQRRLARPRAAVPAQPVKSGLGSSPVTSAAKGPPVRSAGSVPASPSPAANPSGTVSKAVPPLIRPSRSVMTSSGSASRSRSSSSSSSATSTTAVHSAQTSPVIVGEARAIEDAQADGGGGVSLAAFGLGDASLELSASGEATIKIPVKLVPGGK